MRPMNVLSLFDGISAGRLALHRAGLPVRCYMASEINKYAKLITYNNWKDGVQQVGDVKELTVGKLFSYGFPTGETDLLLAGSPCQGFSHAGTLRYFEDERSVLFWEFIRLKNRLKPKWWLLENVPMKTKWKDYISTVVGTYPLTINSSHFSAQHRKRLYWTNIPVAWLPPYINAPRLVDILLPKDEVKDYKLSEAEFEYMHRKTKGGRNHWDYKHHSDTDNDKAACVVANFKKGVPYNVLLDHGVARKFHPIEVERLQTFPDNYTAGVSKTRRYETLGNSWTVDVIAHILKGIGREDDRMR